MVVWNIPHDDPHEYVSSNVPMAAIQEKEEGGEGIQQSKGASRKRGEGEKAKKEKSQELLVTYRWGDTTGGGRVRAKAGLGSRFDGHDAAAAGAHLKNTTATTTAAC